MFWIFKTKKKMVKKEVRYVHITQMDEVRESIDQIINQLSAAIVVAKKMDANSCEVETFRMYKKMFHELWLGVAEYYNIINNVDMEKCSDKRYIS